MLLPLIQGQQLWQILLMLSIKIKNTLVAVPTNTNFATVAQSYMQAVTLYLDMDENILHLNSMIFYISIKNTNLKDCLGSYRRNNFTRFFKGKKFL